MKVYLIRHADAVPLGERGVTEDAERPLSEKGRQQARAVGAEFQERGLHVDLLLTSPLLRARQTGEHMLQAWSGGAPEVRLCYELAPGGKSRNLARFFRDLGVEDVALVGHEPDLGRFAGWLIGSKKAEITFAKAGVAFIPCDDGPRKGSGRLAWLVTPEWFGKAGRKKGGGRG